MSNVWNIFQEKLENNQTLTKTSMKIFMVSSRRYQYFRHLLPNPKVPKSIMGFNNHG